MPTLFLNPLKAAAEWESSVTEQRYFIISEWRKRSRALGRKISREIERKESYDEKEDITVEFLLFVY